MYSMSPSATDSASVCGSIHYFNVNNVNAFVAWCFSNKLNNNEIQLAVDNTNKLGVDLCVDKTIEKNPGLNWNYVMALNYYDKWFEFEGSDLRCAGSSAGNYEFVCASKKQDLNLNKVSLPSYSVVFPPLTLTNYPKTETRVKYFNYENTFLENNGDKRPYKQVEINTMPLDCMKLCMDESECFAVSSTKSMTPGLVTFNCRLFKKHTDYNLKIDALVTRKSFVKYLEYNNLRMGAVPNKYLKVSEDECFKNCILDSNCLAVTISSANDCYLVLTREYSVYRETGWKSFAKEVL